MRLAKAVVIGALASVALACGAGITIPSIPPIPSFPPIVLPSGVVVPSVNPGSAQCALITAAEVQAILGVAVSDQSSSATDCTFLPTNSFTPMSLSLTSAGGIAGIKIVASNGEDLAVGGNPAYYVNFVGDQLYVEKSNQTLLVYALGQTGMRDKLIAIATIAITRF
jgi:hypothetical protein